MRRLPGLQYLAGMRDEVVRRLAPVRANDVNETSDIVKGLVLAGIAPLAGRYRVVARDAQEHAAGVPLKDVDDGQEDLEQKDEEHRPGDVERAAL
jgi:hypothetical protein